jgi:hypothetical protein
MAFFSFCRKEKEYLAEKKTSLLKTNEEKN